MEVRLNKLISDSGLCSRREADRFIEMGRVTVNGKQPEIGVKVQDTDTILVDGAALSSNKNGRKEGIHAAPGKANHLVFGEKGRRKSPPTERKKEDSDKPYGNSKPSKPYGTSSAPGKDRPTKDRPAKATSIPSPYRGKKTTANEGDAEATDYKDGKFGKYNKYAAARKAAKANGGTGKPTYQGSTSKPAYQGGKPKPAGAKPISAKPSGSAKARTGFNDTDAFREAIKPKFGKSISRGAVSQRLAAAPKSASLRKTSKNNPENKAKRVPRNKPSDK